MRDACCNSEILVTILTAQPLQCPQGTLGDGPSWRRSMQDRRETALTSTGEKSRPLNHSFFIPTLVKSYTVTARILREDKQQRISKEDDTRT